MIKRISQILIIAITFVSVNTFAQSSDKIDVHEIVKAQMLNAQGNNGMITKKSVVHKTNNFAFPKLSSSLFSFLIFILGSILIFALVFLRRVRIQHKLISKQFKENIRLVREEKFIPAIDYSLTPVRQSLMEKIGVYLEEQNITELAKKLKIAKGELFLVNNIKNYGSEKRMVRERA